MSILSPFFCLFIPFALCLGLTGLALRWLRARQLLDQPNERSSHATPTPRGGGLALVPALLGPWAVIGTITGDWANLWPLLVAGLALAVISWADDIWTVPPGWRLLAHGLAVAAGLAALPSDALGAPALLFQGLLPLWLDRIIAALAWIWFINLFNFMDGIDGITVVETLFLGLGIAAIDFAAGSLGVTAGYGLALAGVALGFAAWNWQPAKIFLGDVGSVPLGFLAGWLLIRAAAVDHLWLPALVLPLYYLTDATVTLVRRALNKEAVWRPHRQHFYQRAVRCLGRHDSVSLAIGALNLSLLVIAVLAVGSPGWGLMAPLSVFMLLAWMRRLERHTTSA